LPVRSLKIGMNSAMPRPASTSMRSELITVAFHGDAWFGADWSENAVEVTMIFGKTFAADSDEWFGSDLLQWDGFQTSERVRRGHRDTQRVGA
jgi:hypothetical protein